MLTSAMLEVRVFPWRPRPRVMDAGTLRGAITEMDPTFGVDDLGGAVIAFGFWLASIVAAPLVVLLLAGALLSIELPVLVIIAVGLLLVRFAGLIPWTIVITDRVTGAKRRESTRSLLRAMRRVREVNGDRRVPVRWSWA